MLADTGARLGIHAQDDTGCAVANTLAAVDAGATHVQCTANGYGERVGNANLFPVVAALELKYGKKVLPEGALREMTRISHAIAEVVNLTPSTHQPYVGVSAFAHKAGLHASAIKVDPDLYQHIDPEQVGNTMRMLVSDMAGRASIELKGKELGIDLGGDRELVGRVVERVKERELKGYTYEAADASFELLLRAEVEGRPLKYFEVESWRAIVEDRPDGSHANEATVKLWAKGERIVATGGGQRPGQRPRPRPAGGPGEDLPAAGQAGAGRLQGPHPGGQARHAVHDPGPDLHLRRRGGVVDGRASRRTSSPRPGRRWRTPTPTGCCGPGWNRRSRNRRNRGNDGTGGGVGRIPRRPRCLFDTRLGTVERMKDAPRRIHIRLIRLLIVPVAAVLAVLIAGAPGAQAATDVSVIAEKLRESPVYVDPEARDLLAESDAEALANKIEDADKPIFVAVLPGDQPTENLFRNLRTETGVTGLYGIRLGDAFDARADSSVLSPQGVRNLVTSVQGAGDVKAQLNDFVDSALRSTGGGAPAPGPTGPARLPVGGLVTVGALLAAGGAGVYAVTRRNRRRHEEEQRAALEKLRVVVDEDITAFGEELDRLDFHPGESGADDAMRADYEHALDAYEQSKT